MNVSDDKSALNRREIVSLKIYTRAKFRFYFLSTFFPTTRSWNASKHSVDVVLNESSRVSTHDTPGAFEGQSNFHDQSFVSRMLFSTGRESDSLKV